MKKNKENINTLIKRKNIIEKIKKEGIKRVEPKAILVLERHLQNNLFNLVYLLKEEIMASGRKTLKEGDVKRVLLKLREKNYWEI